MRLRCRGEAEGSRGQGGSRHPGVTSRWAVPGDPASRVLTLTTSRTTFGYRGHCIHKVHRHTSKQKYS